MNAETVCISSESFFSFPVIFEDNNVRPIRPNLSG